MNTNKLQALLINHLLKNGSVKLLLPDGIEVEIGINQLDENGELKQTEDYCWVTASQKDRMTILDSYNLGLRFNGDNKALVFEDEFVNKEGEKIRRFDIA
jgi:hypothetical protein